MRLEEGWKERQVSKLGYPVMCLHDGKWVYSRKGLASALGYAKQHDDNDIVNKVEALYKKLGLDSDGKEENAKMNEIEFAAVNIGEMWGKLWDAIRETRHWEYYIEAIYEEDNQKFAILKDESCDLYRLDFWYTEEGLTVAEEVVKVEIEFIETDEIKRFAEPENVMDYRKAEMSDPEPEEEEKVEMSAEEMMARITQLEADIEERDNIIMGKDAEIAELRQYKADREEQDKNVVIGNVLASVQEFMSAEEVEACRTEGMSCEFAQIDAWSNKVKASVVDKVTNKSKKSAEFSFIAAPVVDENEPKNVWDRIK